MYVYTNMYTFSLILNYLRTTISEVAYQFLPLESLREFWSGLVWISRSSVEEPIPILTAFNLPVNETFWPPLISSILQLSSQKSYTYFAKTNSQLSLFLCSINFLIFANLKYNWFLQTGLISIAKQSYSVNTFVYYLGFYTYKIYPDILLLSHLRVSFFLALLLSRTPEHCWIAIKMDILVGFYLKGKELSYH